MNDVHFKIKLFIGRALAVSGVALFALLEAGEKDWRKYIFPVTIGLLAGMGIDIHAYKGALADAGQANQNLLDSRLKKRVHGAEGAAKPKASGNPPTKKEE